MLCLLGSISVFFVGKQVKNMSDGVTDPEERKKNALEQLGGLPEGYSVVASVSFFGAMKTTVLSDQAPLPDGGLAMGGRAFHYYRVMANEQNASTRAFFEGKPSENAGIQQGGIHFDPQAVIKRGELNVEGRRLLYVVARGPLEGRQSGLINAVLFACPDDALRVGLWSQVDPSPDAPAEKVNLEGTVADEAQLARFLKPVNPCGR